MGLRRILAKSHLTVRISRHLHIYLDDVAEIAAHQSDAFVVCDSDLHDLSVLVRSASFGLTVLLVSYY